MLLPGGFKKVGWWILIPALILGVFLMFDGFNGHLLPYIMNDIAIIGILLGTIFITCSRRKFEDEMIGQIRLNALLIALYIHIGIAVLCALFCYDGNYFDAMVWNMFTLPLLFLIVFQWQLWRARKEAGDEK